MSDSVPKTLLAQEFLQLERRSEARHEYVGGVLVAMGGTKRSTTAD